MSVVPVDEGAGAPPPARSGGQVQLLMCNAGDYLFDDPGPLRAPSALRSGHRAGRALGDHEPTALQGILLGEPADKHRPLTWALGVGIRP
jgi:hypothetical protein